MMFFIYSFLDGYGSASVTIQPNTSPENGTCQPVQPNEGWAMDTLYQIRCSGWADQDNAGNPFTYMVVIGEDERRMTFLRSYTPSFDTILPPGDFDNNWKLHIEIWVVDILGGVAVALQQ